MAEKSSDSDNDGTSSDLPGPRPRKRNRKKWGLRCLAGGCNNTAYDGFFIHHFAGAIPTEETRFTAPQQAWIDFIGRKREFDCKLAMTYKKIVLCSGHFREEDYESTQMRMYKHGLRSKPPQLEKDAIPTIDIAKQPFPPEWFDPVKPQVENQPSIEENMYIMSMKKNNRGTQVNIKPPKVCYRSKASMAGSKYWGKNKGMQTEIIQVPRTKDSWTQYDLADIAEDAEVDMEVGPSEEEDGPPEEEDGPPEEEDGPLEDEDEPPEDEDEPPEEEDDVIPFKDDKKKDPDYSPRDEFRDARPRRPKLIPDICLGDQDTLDSDDSFEYGGDSDEDFEDKPAHKRKKDRSKYRKPAFKFPEACPVCSETWKEKREFIRHLQTHIPIDEGPEAIKDAVQSIKSKFEKGHQFDMGWCGECKKLLLRFKSHFNLCHNNDPSYSVLCQQCGKMIRAVYIKMHKISHLEIKESDYVQCPQCPSRFKHQEYLKGHISKSHSDKARSVQCSTCGKILKSRVHLKRHSVIHSGVKPYPCSMCDKSFTQSSNLNIHMRQHTGHKPYVCKLCGMAFTNKVSLKNHKKKLHGIDWWKERESLKKEDPERNKSDGAEQRKQLI